MDRMLRKAKSMILRKGNTSNNTLDHADTGISLSGRNSSFPLNNPHSNLSGSSSSIPFNSTRNPPNDPPVAKDAPHSSDDPMNILAFRTITMLIANIQQEKPLIFFNNEAPTDGDSDVLQLANAFANLAITNHGTIALTTRICKDELQVIACTTHDDNNQLMHQSPPSKVSNIWNMLFSPNPRRDGLTSDKAYPTIVDTTVPSGVDPSDNVTLLRYIEAEW